MLIYSNLVSFAPSVETRFLRTVLNRINYAVFCLFLCTKDSNNHCQTHLTFLLECTTIISLAINKPILKRFKRMYEQELINYTNKLFKLFIIDLMQSKSISRYRIAKDTGLTEQFFSNKFNGYSKRFVSLPTIYLIANTYNFTFDLLKYDKQYKQLLNQQSKQFLFWASPSFPLVCWLFYSLHFAYREAYNFLYTIL